MDYRYSHAVTEAVGARTPDRSVERWSQLQVHAVWIIVVAGILLRLRELLHNRSLWRDEASLVYNLRHRGLLGFTRPLDHDQGTPAGFFVLAQNVGRWLGGTEWAYRAVPFVASCLALVVVASLVRRHLDPVAGFVSVAVLAASGSLVYYAAEVKQYSVDMAVAVALLWVADWGFRRRWDGASTATLAIAGALGLLTSYPAVFVLPPIGVLAVIGARRDRGAVRRLFAVGSCWTAVLAATYVAWTSDLNESDFLRDFWDAGFLPLPPRSSHELEVWGGALRTLITQLLHPDLLVPIAILAAIGSIQVARSSPAIATALGGPVALAIVASAFELYPVIERSILFALPASAIAIGAGTSVLGRNFARREAWYCWIPVLLVAAPALSPALRRAAAPPEQEELRPILAELAGQEDGAVVVVTDTSEVAWDYYADRFGLRPRSVLLREFDRLDLEAAARVVAELPRTENLWFVDVAFWRPVGSLDPAVVKALDRSGRRVYERHEKGASVHVYDLGA